MLSSARGVPGPARVWEQSLPGRSLAWLASRWSSHRAQPARLAMLERITLGPRQALALVEADGFRLLVALTPEGPAAFYALPAPGKNPAAQPGHIPQSGLDGLVSAPASARRPRRASVQADRAQPDRSQQGRVQPDRAQPDRVQPGRAS